MLVKNNHPSLHKKLHAFFTGSCLFGAEFERATQQNVEHGRVETRSILSSSDLPRDYSGFPGVVQAFCLTRRVVFKKTGELREETLYGMTDLSSKQAPPSELLRLVRGHWHIENKSHHLRDVTFDEDRSQLRKGSAPQVLAGLRNLAVGALHTASGTKIESSLRWISRNRTRTLDILGQPNMTRPNPVGLEYTVLVLNLRVCGTAFVMR